MGQLLGERSLDQRIAEIKTIIDRMDFRWDKGFVTDRDTYVQKRMELQQELEKLTPIPHDDLERAADILQNFANHWQATGDDREAQKSLLQLIVSRVQVRDGKVVAIILRPNYCVTV